ncbi:hypothetical protein DXG01_000154 [Tephrocybe rancida]|nr:hypothetical protein DXG01_000154 [Tephrocybe rancida]
MSYHSSAGLASNSRLTYPPEISNPQLVVLVGSFGLASNLLGLLLFHANLPANPHLAELRQLQKQSMASLRRSNPHTPPAGHSEFSGLYGHPAATRAALVQHMALASESISPNQPLITDSLLPGGDAAEDTPLLSNGTGHRHSHGHSDGSMNMRALVLHVIGDALGNVGVISTGLVIWLTQWSFKYYFDPLVSLVITVIIFSSAMPLGVPPTISLDRVRESILEVDGVRSVHELHVWQLSESKVIASVHVLASRDHDFMPVAVKIRKALHDHGIHSSTIQPEYSEGQVLAVS